MLNVYHLISVKIAECWYKLPHVYLDGEFENLINLVDGYMPMNMRAFHFGELDQLLLNRVIEQRPVMNFPIHALFTGYPLQPIKLIPPSRDTLLNVRRKFGDFVLAESDYGWRLYKVDGQSGVLITAYRVCPITLKEASAYVKKYHRHNSGPKFHKFSISLRVDGEPEPVGVVIASTPKARWQMDGSTLEINRCCSDSRYFNVCSKLYGLAIRAGRNLGYSRFLSYTLPEESGASLKAAGFHLEGMTAVSKNGWDCPSRPRLLEKYPEGSKLRWVLDHGK